MARSDDFSEPYLPERYRQKIRDKQRGRFKKKILLVAIPGAIIVIVLAFLAGCFSSTPGPSAPHTTGTSTSHPDTIIGSQAPITPSGTVIPASDTSDSGADRQEVAPRISQEEAQEKAIRIITERNGGSLPPLNLTSVRYGTGESPGRIPRGIYTFFFERLYHDHPVDTDGIQVTVDAGTGDVTGYDRRWITPDFAFSQADEPAITRQEAIFAVLDAVKIRLPRDAERIHITSSELRWNSQHTSESSLRPGSVPLAYKVSFDISDLADDTARTEGIAWVDIGTGNITSLVYPN